MFALKAGQGAGSGAGAGARGWRLSFDGFVLPRWLRRPARLFARMLAGEVEPPRFAATIASALFLGASVAYGAVEGGHTPEIVKSVTSRAGFAIDEIRISGNRETSEIDVFQSIGLDGWTSLVGFDADMARARIMALPWVQSASVRKVYPSALEVKIAEKVPFAIWQQGRRLVLVEQDGTPIAPMVGRRHAGLPLVVGEGAAEQAATFLATVARHPEVSARVAAYVRLSDRRWNLRLRSGITVKLPEQGAEAALREIAALDRSHELLSRDIEAIDMRLGDRLVVRLSQDAASAREAALKKRLGKEYRPVERPT